MYQSIGLKLQILALLAVPFLTLAACRVCASIVGLVFGARSVSHAAR